jgi:hypothetical protein
MNAALRLALHFWRECKRRKRHWLYPLATHRLRTARRKVHLLFGDSLEELANSVMQTYGFIAWMTPSRTT